MRAEVCGAVCAAAAADLRAAVEVISADDPMRMAEALRNEGKVFADWLEKQLDAPGGMTKVKEIQSASTGNAAIDKQVAAMDAAAIRADLPKLRAAYVQLDSAWGAATLRIPVASLTHHFSNCCAQDISGTLEIGAPARIALSWAQERFLLQRVGQRSWHQLDGGRLRG